MEVKIRPAEDYDFDRIYEIWSLGIQISFPNTIMTEELLEDFNKNFNTRNHIYNFWVITDDDKYIHGWQSLTKFSVNPIRIGKFAESSTYICPNSKLKGLGKQLLKFMIHSASESNLEFIIGFVAEDNLAARKITKDTGWEEIGKFPLSKKYNYPEKLILVKHL